MAILEVVFTAAALLVLLLAVDTVLAVLVGLLFRGIR
jgi:hypothetical protein